MFSYEGSAYARENSEFLFCEIPGISVSYPPDSSKEDNLGKPDEDEEHARIMAKLDELEKEEIEEGSTSGSDEDDEDSFLSNVNDDKNEASEVRFDRLN